MTSALSTSAEMACAYMNRGVNPDAETAGRLLEDILVDTQFFRAEGTTQKDRLTAVALANIANIDIERFSKEIKDRENG